MQRIQTRIRLAEAYNVDRDTITRWLRRIGITHRSALTPIDLEIIFNKIGDPNKMKELAEKFAKK